MPFITEEIWQSVAPLLALKEKSITQRRYPGAQDLPASDVPATAEIEWLRAVLTQIRRIRSEMNIAPAKAIPLLFAAGNAADRARTQKFGAQIAFLAKSESQCWLEADETEPASAAAIVGEMKVLIPLAGLIDLGAEKLRLDKETKRLEGEIAKSTTKLANFGPKTPPTVVEQEKQRIAEFTTTLSGLRDQAGQARACLRVVPTRSSGSRDRFYVRTVVDFNFDGDSPRDETQIDVFLAKTEMLDNRWPVQCIPSVGYARD